MPNAPGGCARGYNWAACLGSNLGSIGALIAAFECNNLETCHQVHGFICFFNVSFYSCFLNVSFYSCFFEMFGSILVSHVNICEPVCSNLSIADSDRARNSKNWRIPCQWWLGRDQQQFDVCSALFYEVHCICTYHAGLRQDSIPHWDSEASGLGISLFGGTFGYKGNYPLRCWIAPSLCKWQLCEAPGGVFDESWTY